MQQTSPLDGYRDQIEALLAQGVSYRKMADKLRETDIDTTERSVRRAVRRWGLQGHRQSRKQHYGPQFEDPGMKMMGDEADITSDPRVWKAYLNDTTALLTERGLEPEDWEIYSLIVNEWDSPTGETLKQLKVHLKRKKSLKMLVPARVALGRTWRHSTTPSDPHEPELVVFVGDQHAPFHDSELHKRFCAFLDDQVPERGVLMGDILELNSISRHQDEPDWPASTQECVNAGGQVILDYREASDATNWVMLPGNHDERLRRVIIDRLGDWYGLKPAQIEKLPDLPPIHDPVYLLRLDELGVTYLTHTASYKHAQHMVSPYLAARHGDKARRGSGTTARITLDNLDHSIVMGHTHRQSLVQKTVYQVDGSGRLLQAGETGCMCRIEDGLGYAPQPDWSNGFITAAVWPDGTFKLDLATYVDGHIYWRSERY